MSAKTNLQGHISLQAICRLLMLPILVILSPISTPAFVTNNELMIQNSCLQPSPNVSSEKALLAARLNKLQEVYSNQSSRTVHRKAFVHALDEAISSSSFAYLLKCRGPRYKLNFLNPENGNQTMSVATDGNTKPVILNFDLVKSVQSVLFVYIHELTHVCQNDKQDALLEKFEDLASKLEPHEQGKFWGYIENGFPLGDLGRRFKAVDNAYGNFIRQGIFGEIEAFYTQQLAYREFVQLSPSLCHRSGEPTDAPALFTDYILQERDLSNGFFAQVILHNYEKHYQEGSRYWYVRSSAIQNYKDDSGELSFSIPSIHPELKQLIKKLNILMKQP